MWVYCNELMCRYAVTYVRVSVIRFWLQQQVMRRQTRRVVVPVAGKTDLGEYWTPAA